MRKQAFIIFGLLLSVALSAQQRGATKDIAGKDYLYMHGYDGQEDYRSKLLIKELTWSADGWPKVIL